MNTHVNWFCVIVLDYLHIQRYATHYTSGVITDNNYTAQLQSKMKNLNCNGKFTNSNRNHTFSVLVPSSHYISSIFAVVYLELQIVF